MVAPDSCLPYLKAAVYTTSSDVGSSPRIRDCADGQLHTAFGILGFDKISLHELRVNTDSFCFKVKNSDRTIQRGCKEEVSLLGMPLSISKSCNMALSIRHILDVHVPSNCHLYFSSIFIVYPSLIVRSAAQEVLAIWIKRECSYRMAVKGTILSHRLQFPVHSWEIPDLQQVI